MIIGNRKYGMGWLPDYPDIRDFSIDHDEVTDQKKALRQDKSVKQMLKKAGVLNGSKKKLQSSVDHRSWCSPIEDQEDLGSCTAHAGVGMVEYFEKRAFGRHVDASRLFLYKVTRNLIHLSGDTGAFLRSTMGAIALFGIPPEEYWPYNISDFEKEPTPFCYSFAQNYQAISYYRLDSPGTSTDDILKRIKLFLSAGLPTMFGFTVYRSIDQAGTSGKIPYPSKNDSEAGGHAVMTVGYDDNMKILNTNPGSIATKGALLIRNSWGTGWGENGYGWLPYDYILNGLADDWWSLLKNEWIDTGKFQI